MAAMVMQTHKHTHTHLQLQNKGSDRTGLSGTCTYAYSNIGELSLPRSTVPQTGNH